MMLFCSMLIMPSVASSRKLILPDRKDAWSVSECDVAARSSRGASRSCLGVSRRRARPGRRRSAAARARPGSRAPSWSDRRARPMRAITLGSRGAWRRRRRAARRRSRDSWSISPPTRSRMSAMRSMTASSSRQHRRRRGRPASAALAAYRRTCGTARVGVAHRDQPVAGQDERDGAASGRSVSALRHDGRRHVQRAVLLVEAARGLDLPHLLARRHVDAEQPPRPRSSSSVGSSRSIQTALAGRGPSSAASTFTRQPRGSATNTFSMRVPSGPA